MTQFDSKQRFNLVRFKEIPVLGIIRGAPQNAIEGILNACILGGIKFVELTLNSENALSLISLASQKFSKDLCVGAGTVLSLTDAQLAAEAGANFIVSPTLNIDVATYCNKKGLAYFPGALTPTEIEKAWGTGAAMVKVFPASQMGANYFNTVCGPFNELLLMAVGGIDSSNAVDYLNAGASAVAIGGSVFTESRMKNKKFNDIQQAILGLVISVKNFNRKP
ncbi:MAG TPA: bifunctional 4-hydroxy-2-oxoglutarate aldolase/2-dehydro-3-deoxy-phosphogluconate aldolase [Nitrospinaceae bacterium]|nr:bifunctional 4-hydroxy-2-oxoglutarate aldolase/2-dehydro-3-deoxy-phosphogluconate aldolase [Nitrospinaceae bacterium]